MFNLGMGLLQQGGPRVGPKISFGQALAGASQYANNRMSEVQKLQAQRQLLQQNQRQQQAMSQIQGLLSQPASAVPPMIRRPGAVQAQQAQLQGLLAQANPQAYTQQLIQSQFGQPQQAPNAIREVQALTGFTPGTPEFLAAYKQLKGNNPTPLEQAQLNKLMLDTENLIEERRNAQAQQTQEKEILKIGIESGVKDMIKLNDVNNQLDQTFLQSGIPFTEGRRALSGGIEAVRGAFGLDNESASRLNSNYDLFKKISSDFAGGTMERLGGTSTNFRLQNTLDANANLAAAPAANRFVIASNLQELLAQARAQGVEIPEADKRAAQEIIDSVFSPNVVNLQDLPE